MIHTITSSNPKFIADAMLGRFAKKLRLFGFDCIYVSDIDDSRLLEIAKIEKRIILTKDEDLCSNAKKQNLSYVNITTDDEVGQFIQLNSILELQDLNIDSNTSRCSVCNGMLEKTKKPTISDKVHPRVLEINDEFWTCTECKKIYWEGTHMINLQKFLGRLHEKFGQAVN